MSTVPDRSTTPYTPGAPALDHAAVAADHMLALVVAADPTFQVTAERHDAAVALVEAIVAALSSRRSDR